MVIIHVFDSIYYVYFVFRYELVQWSRNESSHDFGRFMRGCWGCIEVEGISRSLQMFMISCQMILWLDCALWQVPLFTPLISVALQNSGKVIFLSSQLHCIFSHIAQILNARSLEIIRLIIAETEYFICTCLFPVCRCPQGPPLAVCCTTVSKSTSLMFFVVLLVAVS